MSAKLFVQPKPNSGLFEIKTSVGPPPIVLTGAYTSHREAKLAIDSFRRISFKDIKTSPQAGRTKRKVTAAAKLKEQAEVANGSKIIGESGEYTAG